MEVGKEWLIRFVLDVPRPTRKRLINLGLPVAGIDFEVKNDGSVVFGGALRVSRDGKFYWGSRQLTAREFVNAASLLSHYDRGVVEGVRRMIDLKNSRVLGGNNLRLGRVVVEKFVESRFMDVIREDVASVRYKLPPGVGLVYFHGGWGVVVRRGPFRVKMVHYYEWGLDDSAHLYYNSIYASQLGVWDFKDALRRGDVEEVVRVANETVFEAIEKRGGWGYKVFSHPMFEVYEFGSAAIVTEGDPFEVYEAVDRTLINGGWKFYHVDWRGGFYRKRVSEIRLEYDGGGLRMFFVLLDT